MMFFLLSLAHAATPNVMASMHDRYRCSSNSDVLCVYVQAKGDPSLVQWDIPDETVLVVMPGATLDATLVPGAQLHSVYAGLPFDNLPDEVRNLIDNLFDDEPNSGSGSTSVFINAGGIPLTIGSQNDLGGIDLGPTIQVSKATLALTSADVGPSRMGCLHAENSDITVTNGTFHNCFAEEGGAIHATNSTVTITDTTFKDNEAWGDNGGGAIHATNSTVTIMNTTFKHNEALGADGGGDISFDGNDLSLSNTTHKGFHAWNGSGGSVRFAGQELAVSGSTFRNGSSLDMGGAIQVLRGSASVATSTFTNTWSYALYNSNDPYTGLGGAIAIADASGSFLTVTDCQFSQVWAGDAGGALYLGSGTEATVDRTQISEADARWGGGIIAHGDLTLTNSLISGTPYASVLGGGGLFAADGAQVSIINTGFEDTHAITGGALHLQRVASATVEGSWFCNTSAEDAGGAVYHVPEPGSSVEVRHSLFVGSTVQSPLPSKFGPVWYTDTSDLSVVSASLDHVTAKDFQGGHPISPADSAVVSNSLFSSKDWSLPTPYSPPFSSGNYLYGVVVGSGMTPPPLLVGASTLLCGEEAFQLHPINGLAGTEPWVEYETNQVWSMANNPGPLGFDPKDGPSPEVPWLDPGALSSDPPINWYADGDLDGFPRAVDCDDGNSSVHPAALEYCNGLDNDCDGHIDTSSRAWLADQDQDRHSSDPKDIRFDCFSDGDHGVPLDDNLGYDCDDQNNEVYDGAPERCDGLDNDCDGLIDGFDPDQLFAADDPLWYLDPDGDGWVSADDAVAFCDDETAEALGLLPDTQLGDCQPHAAAIHPEAPERCDGLDDDCDGIVDNTDRPWLVDQDRDGHAPDADDIRLGCIPAGLHGVPLDDNLGYDCDDTNPRVHTGAIEVVDNGIDDDCSGGDARSYVAGGCSVAPRPLGLPGLLTRRR